MTEVYLNFKFVGTVENADEFVQRVIDERRKNTLPKKVNIFYEDVADEVYVSCSKGRLRRPLIVVKDGKPLLTEAHIKQIEKNEISWQDLVDQGIIEYLDAGEEENIFLAMFASDITPEHTHLEVNPLTILGLVASLVPFGNYSPGRMNIIGTKNQRQAIGFYAANYSLRLDTDINLLVNPQIPVVTTLANEICDYEKHPSGQNIVVAVLTYEGYNMEDALIFNKSSIDRGLARSIYFRLGTTEELRYSGGLIDEVCIPDKEVKGYKTENDYRLLEDDGIIYPEAKISESDVLIGKTSPPRFLSTGDEYNLTANIRRESSVTMPHAESGTVDFVVVTENEEGNKLVEVRIRSQKVPEIGDKFISRFGQKGVIGMLKKQEDMPFTASGIIPDLIFSPYSLPSRMTVSHLLEMLGGKTGSLSGRYVDGTTFSSEPEKKLREELSSLGFRDNGTETMYNGRTGEQFKVKIFVGNMFYLKLKHMVSNRIQTRAMGPIQLLTRQPSEGRGKQGGLRLGEMEKDCFVAHGASLLLKERFDSDKTIVPVCEKCGLIAVYNEFKDKSYCSVCGEGVDISNIEISYAFKLLLDEFKSIGIYPQLKLKNKY
tara:strand:- start:42135 stop:43937 length:1803 start_codon:yes stop_codon:yes gene_type:complete